MVEKRAAGPTGLDTDAGEPGGRYLSGYLLGLKGAEAMRGMATAARPDRPLGDQQAAALGEYTAGLGEPGLPIGPVMNRAQRPDDGGACVGQRKVLGAALEPRDVAGGRR